MSLFTQAATFPAILLPAFIGAALFLAVLLAVLPRNRKDIAAGVCIFLALGCAGVAVLLFPRHLPDPRVQASRFTPHIDVDMMVSGGDGVELWLNDWQHRSERVQVIAGERHVYQFNKVPGHITLLRLDPTDVPNARIVIYSVTMKANGETVQHFGPAELKAWNLHEVSEPREEEGGLSMRDTTDDPILWAPLNIQLPETRQVARPSLVQLYYRPVVMALAALLLLMMARLATRWSKVCVLPVRYRERLLSGWVTGVVVLLAAGSALYLQTHAATSNIGIEVDMMVNRGNGVEMWLNDWQHPSERLPVVAGQRHMYRFTQVPHEITLLRLDPTDLPDARIVIYSVAIRSRNKIFQQFGPAELKTWNRVNLSAAQEQDGGVVMAGLTDDPILTAPMEVRLPGGIVDVFCGLLELPESPILLPMAVFLLILLMRMLTGTGRMEAVMIAVASCALYPVVLLVIRLNLLPPPGVKSTVGFASYNGYPKGNEYLAAFCALLVCVGLGYGFARLGGRREEESEETPATGGRWKVWLTHAAVFALLFLYFLPDMRESLRSLSGLVHPYRGWDDENIVAWGYMVNTGLRPFRDFWYPYSGAYLQILPFPVGTILWVLHGTVALWVLYVGLFKVTGRRLVRALVVFSVIAAPVLLELLVQWTRYLLAVDIAFLYVALCDDTRLNWMTQVPFAAFVAYVFFYDPTQVVYAGMGIAVHTALAALARFQGRDWRERLTGSAQVLKQRLRVAGVPMVAGVAAALLVYAANGMLPGLWDFERSVGDQGTYGAVPSEIGNWVQPILQPDTVFLLMLLLSSYAVYHWVRATEKDGRDPLGSALIVLCVMGYVAMQKQILRPHVMTQVRLFPFVALLVFGLMVWRERKPAVRMAIAVLLGCSLGIAGYRDLVQGIYRADMRGPAKIRSAAEVLLHDRKECDTANAAVYAPSRFVGFDAEKAVVDHLTQAGGLRPEDSIYVLGDSPVFYMLLNRRPPYITNSYNDSPIYEQQKVVTWLERQHPRFVIWGTNDLQYDTVPHTVRLPLIYSYVFGHYRFLRAIGSYQILTELPVGQAADLEYWRGVLGDRVDLGHVPGQARVSEYEACGGDVARCDAVLLVRYRQQPAPRGKLTVDVDALGGPFRVQFAVAPEEREYVVNLNRLWFWEPLSRAAAPRITPEEAGPEVVMEYRRERGAVLY